MTQIEKFAEKNKDHIMQNEIEKFSRNLTQAKESMMEVSYQKEPEKHRKTRNDI